MLSSGRIPTLTPDIIPTIVLPSPPAKGVVKGSYQIMIGGLASEDGIPMAADGRVTQRRKPAVTRIPLDPVRQPSEPRAKPTAAGLGVDLASLDWQRSGTGPGSFEVAFVASQARNSRAAAGQVPVARPGPEAGSDCPAIDWVLLRVAGDPVGRVLVYDRNEWLCFIDGAARGEFDWRQELNRRPGPPPESGPPVEGPPADRPCRPLAVRLSRREGASPAIS
jgi:hypothetical protein